MCPMDPKDCPFHEKLEEMRVDIKETNTLLKGNGEIGVLEQQRINRRDIDRILKKQESSTVWAKELMTWVFRIYLLYLFGLK